MQTIDADICKHLAQELRRITPKDNIEERFLVKMERLCKGAASSDQNAVLSDKQYKWLEDILMRISGEW